MTAVAERIRLSRAKGYRLPAGAVKVDRSTKWGNPWKVCGAASVDHAVEHDGHECRITAEDAVAAFRYAVLFPVIGQPEVPTPDEIRRELAGKDLACWCSIKDTVGRRVPCHADVLLEISNEVLHG